ncbi:MULTISPECIES: LysR family transcriptional regulator [Rhodomicrobium]|uniref:LysR family transcriptional regulator n=1 Tax=Rhodomicrobium TaxID=1068 RepID=UPI000B4A6FB0|nr:MULTISPECIES: LysR family transcriptional regulator [Rhodomicrobium]
MDRLDAMRLFTRIVERRSFAQAARDLGIPKPSVTYAIRQLEARLGTRLLDRTTRQVRPTADGIDFYERCLRLLADFDETEGAFRHVTPQGPLRADLQGSLAQHFVMPALPGFVARYPDISLRLSETDRLIDLVAEGVDCVLRAGEPADSGLVGKRVACFEWLTCATPAYLERYGMPQSLDDLQGHRMVGYLHPSGQRDPLEFCDGGGVKQIELPSFVTVTGSTINSAAALAGLGLIQLPRYKVHDLLRQGVLREVLPGLPPPSMPVWVLYPESRFLLQRVRVFVDWLAEVFAAAPHQSTPKRR